MKNDHNLKSDNHKGCEELFDFYIQKQVGNITFF